VSRVEGRCRCLQCSVFQREQSRHCIGCDLRLKEANQMRRVGIRTLSICFCEVSHYSGKLSTCPTIEYYYQNEELFEQSIYSQIKQFDLVAAIIKHDKLHTRRRYMIEILHKVEEQEQYHIC
jgi:hypothetical protein